MDPTGDELAGVADLFGGLTREEFADALEELAFKRGAEIDESVVDDAVAEARDAYRLVGIDRDGDRLLVAGPTAFPELPDGAEDLPHIMDVDERAIDRETAGEAARERLVDDAEATIRAGDTERIDELLDVSYDLEAWAPVDVADVREVLDAARERQ